MRAREPGGELREAPFGEGRVREGVGFFQGATAGLLHVLHAALGRES